MRTNRPTGMEVELALEVVKPECEERAERCEREGGNFWTWNTTPEDLAKVVPGKKGVPS